jgi:SAM-dependent methyltransferase
MSKRKALHALKFDSDDYWFATIWDRGLETVRANRAVREIFQEQVEVTVDALSKVVRSSCVGHRLQILDLGCGPGYLSEVIAKTFPGRAEITLADSNPVALSLASKRLHDYSGIRQICCSAYSVHEKTEIKYDVIVCLDLFHHLSDLDRVFNAIVKVLAPGGILIGNVFDRSRYIEFDRLKYGSIGSWRRSVAHSLGNILYSFSPQSGKRLIRRMGWCRIAPIDRDEFLNRLSGYLTISVAKRGFYLWFLAGKPLSPQHLSVLADVIRRSFISYSAHANTP